MTETKIQLVRPVKVLIESDRNIEIYDNPEAQLVIRHNGEKVVCQLWQTNPQNDRECIRVHHMDEGDVVTFDLAMNLKYI